MKNGKIFCLHINNKLSYHNTEDLPTLLKSLGATQLNVLGETTTSQYLNNEKSFQETMKLKKKKYFADVDHEDLEDIR